MTDIAPATVDWSQFDRDCQSADKPLPLFRQQLKDITNTLQVDFEAGAPIDSLVTRRAALMDQLLRRAWHCQISEAATDIALVAVGGYGRGELHPASDIDLLILLEDDNTLERHSGAIGAFILFLWDMGLEVGHSTRSISECVSLARQDITVATNLMEARQLAGPSSLFAGMKAVVGPDSIWPSGEFFRAKLEEQVARHHRYHDSGYNLEPNIKESPGGLRDLQIIGWVAKRHFGVETLHDLVAHEFLTEHEYHALMDAQNFLWRVRWALHSLSGRHEDRLLFDHQRSIATQFGYTDQSHRLAVELFMRDYYRTVQELSRLNEMLLQLFEEEILLRDESAEPVPLSANFQSRHSYLEVTHDDVFLHEPTTLLAVFVLLAKHPELRGVRANTIRLIRDHRYLIDEEFRRNPRAHALFIELFRQGQGLTHQLRRMNRYGVLAAYLPIFANIVGQMQHDLFHVYTVDEHTMFVVRNLRRFTVPEFADEFPFCSQLIQQIERQEVLTLAGFFHDIGKGRGGDHSQLGAADAVNFCRDHGLSEEDTGLVKWLVENHLIMSTTAQRKDISDPDVINAFAERVGSQKHLDHLYLLTVADIRATSPSLWNSWKHALLKDLYNATSQALKQGLDKPLEMDNFIRETQTKALNILLLEYGCDKDAVLSHWENLGEDYFLRHTEDEVAWHTHGIINKPASTETLVLVSDEPMRGGTEVFVYARDANHLFAVITSVLEQLALDITDARIITTTDQHALDTFLVLEQDGEIIRNRNRLYEIQLALTERLSESSLLALPPIRLSRQLKHFPIATKVQFRDDPGNERTIVEVTTGDRPGLLARLARALMECGILLQNAKIATLGERVEDIFFVTDKELRPLPAESQTCLRETILRLLKT